MQSLELQRRTRHFSRLLDLLFHKHEQSRTICLLWMVNSDSRKMWSLEVTQTEREQPDIKLATKIMTTSVTAIICGGTLLYNDQINC